MIESYPSEASLTVNSRSSQSGNESEKRISFGVVEFHEHAIVLGDNPSTSHGPSLEIDWVVQSRSTVKLDEYESTRFPRRHKQQLIMPGEMRTSLLLESGFTMREIRDHVSCRSTKSRPSARASITQKLSRILPRSK